LIGPYLIENERLFGACPQGRARAPFDVYRKVAVRGLSVLADTENC
jgi:hypothetical protein